MSKQRQKGTTEETAIVNDWNREAGYKEARRMPAGARYDVHVDGFAPVVDVLSIRVDRGERLVTLRFADFARLWQQANKDLLDAPELHIESKRYARMAIATIFEKKFGRQR